MSEENEDFIVNDLSFLEDIDIDGIVEFLNETDNVFYTKGKEYDDSLLMSQDSRENKKINVSKIQECEEIFKSNDSLLNTQLKKVNITIKASSKYVASESTNIIENGLHKSTENKQIFLNFAISHDCGSIINNNYNKIIDDSPKLEENVLDNNVNSAPNTAKLYMRSNSDDNVKYNTNVKKYEVETSNKCYFLLEPENIKNRSEHIPENTKDTSTNYDKMGNISTNRSRHNTNKNLESNNSNKSISLKENKTDALKNTKHTPIMTSIVINEKSSISSDFNRNIDSKKFKKQDNYNENKFGVSKMTKHSSAISVVIRKDDLYLADKLQKRLYQFLNVKFSDLNIFHYGRYSKIFECQQNGKKYALKVINPILDIKQYGTEKGKILNHLQHGIQRNELCYIYLFASFGLETSWCLLFDFYPTNLREKLQTHGPMQISTVENLSRQLIKALNRLRSLHIIHSDIKPEHILLNDSTSVLKLCGFDRAYHMDNETILPNIGTPSYRAPEVILGYSASFSIDMWSSALVIYEMMTDIRLFPGCFNNEILYKQMCIFGNMPLDMITNSMYGANHFFKRKFLKREGHCGKDIRVIDNFFENMSYKNKPFKVYNKYWRCAVTSEVSQAEDIKKMTMLVDILDKMLILHPYDRIPIEVLYVDPFMLQSFC